MKFIEYETEFENKKIQLHWIRKLTGNIYLAGGTYPKMKILGTAGNIFFVRVQIHDKLPKITILESWGKGELYRRWLDVSEKERIRGNNPRPTRLRNSRVHELSYEDISERPCVQQHSTLGPKRIRVLRRS